MIYTVYEIMNVLGTVEYVGMTSNYNRRKWRHFAKPTKHHGKFFGRMDCIIYPVSCFTSKEDALILEKELHEFHNLKSQGQKISDYLRKKFGPVKLKIPKKRGRPKKLHGFNQSD